MKQILLTLALMTSAFAQNTEIWTNLWPGKAPGAPTPKAGSEKVNKSGHYTNIESPQYLLYTPEKPSGQCVVVLPGGGYRFVSMNNEGRDIAKNLTAQGITAMVVKYRVASQASYQYQFPVPLLDARRAIRTARAMASEWKIDPKKIGVMGFSAGGHLAASAATMFDQTFEAETKDAIDQQSCRPDFAVLGYPVILMGDKMGHRGSEHNLVGKNADEKTFAKVKVVDLISKNTPPVYLVHSADDSLVPLKNSTDFAARCAELKVPVSGQFFADGGHGYGAAGRKTAKGWMDQIHVWLKQQK